MSFFFLHTLAFSSANLVLVRLGSVFHVGSIRRKGGKGEEGAKAAGKEIEDEGQRSPSGRPTIRPFLFAI